MAGIIGLIVCLIAEILVAWISWKSAPETIVSRPGPGPFAALLSIDLAFDSDYAILWDTQIPALELIRGAGRKGVTVRVLGASYRSNARRYPELYDGGSFQQWLTFLESAQLIACDGNRVMLTAEAQKFLECRLTSKELHLLKAPSN